VIRRLGRNKTVLFSSHILQEVEALCDKVVIIHKGRLVADDQLSRLRQQKGNSVKVTFKGAPDHLSLEELRGVKKVVSLGSQQWELQTDEPDEVKKQLMELALLNNLNIVSLHSENQSLEDVFRQLTTNHQNLEQI
jgi:ABC-2 type transport system ATP-binding protein